MIPGAEVEHVLLHLFDAKFVISIRSATDFFNGAGSSSGLATLKVRVLELPVVSRCVLNLIDIYGLTLS
jgi:hypothetical protein